MIVTDCTIHPLGFYDRWRKCVRVKCLCLRTNLIVVASPYHVYVNMSAWEWGRQGILTAVGCSCSAVRRLCGLSLVCHVDDPTCRGWTGPWWAVPYVSLIPWLHMFFHQYLCLWAVLALYHLPLMCALKVQSKYLSSFNFIYSTVCSIVQLCFNYPIISISHWTLSPMQEVVPTMLYTQDS